MGKIKYLERVREFMKKTPVFRAKDIEIIAKKYSHLLLHNLAKRCEIKRVTKGWYSLSDDPIVSVFCFRPAYIGLQEALSIYGLWEQETNTVLVTTHNVRTGVRKILGNNVIVHKINKKYFFGCDYMKYDNFFVPVSDIEKTMIDLVYFNEIPDKKILMKLKKRSDIKKLNNYLHVYPKKFRKKVMLVLGIL